MSHVHTINCLQESVSPYRPGSEVGPIGAYLEKFDVKWRVFKTCDVEETSWIEYWKSHPHQLSLEE